MVTSGIDKEGFLQAWHHCYC